MQQNRELINTSNTNTVKWYFTKFLIQLTLERKIFTKSKAESIPIYVYGK